MLWCSDYFDNLYVHLHIYAKLLLTHLKIQLSASRLFMQNTIFFLISSILLGNKTPFPLAPIFYANNVQKIEFGERKIQGVLIHLEDLANTLNYSCTLQPYKSQSNPNICKSK